MEAAMLLSGIIEAAERNRTQRSSDYTDADGFLCCGECHERKQTVLEKGPLRGKKVFCMCACDRKAQELEEQKRFAEKVRERKERCFSHKALWNRTFANDTGKQPKIKYAKDYVENWERMREKNVGLIFLGGVGTGKSYAACSIANALCERDIGVKFINFAEVLNDLQCCPDRNAYLRKLTEYSLLIIDDFGIQRDTEYANEQLFNLIEQRKNSRKPLIVTTNLTLRELRNPTDTKYERIYDRILGLGEAVMFEGTSLRQDEHRDKRAVLTEVFSS